MKHFLSVCLSLAMVGFVSCHDSDDDDTGPSTPSGEALVQDLILNSTNDSAEPIEINDLDLQFSEDEDAFAGSFE